MQTISLDPADNARYAPILRQHYSHLYANQCETSDSPDESRTSMSRKMMKALQAWLRVSRILNVGSGAQALEAQFLSAWNQARRPSLNDTPIITIDQADIPLQNLRVAGKTKNRFKNVMHVRTDAVDLPFANDTFGLIVSNLAIDFAPRKAFEEAMRVLAPGWQAMFHLHHPLLVNEIDLDTLRDPTVRAFWKHLRDNKALFQSEEAIATYFDRLGFQVQYVGLEQTKRRDDRWWTTTLQKPNVS